jgi:BolA protein
MTTFIDQIKEKIIKKLKPEKVLVIDNSNLHTKHKSFDPTKYHIKLIIKSEKLKKMTKINAHKEIFFILDYEIKNNIHALEIEIR